ncbi:unnamed protein product [Miscanthus lutarioriparius]|uniref:Uncharacterized protein n=1 Tax=Miscanthus lutarioriparius TaxID=422564 RepID=A0A811M9F4_9POAL|nr:unnamed protein product [Miscanthus lutarioriparius]
MARVEANWERLVRGVRLVGAYGQPVTGIAGNVSSLGNNVHIEEVLCAADEIQDEDPTVEGQIWRAHVWGLLLVADRRGGLSGGA